MDVPRLQSEDAPPAGAPSDRAALDATGTEPPLAFGELLHIVTEAGLDPTELHHRDPSFVRAVIPYLDVLTTAYFRPEYEGTENIPATGPFLAVGNHNGGPILPDLWTALVFWAKTFGADFPMYCMVHDVAFALRFVGNVFMKLGGLRACTLSAERVMEARGGLLVYPGGELDCYRSFWDRNRIDLHGRTGFIKLAIKYGAPIMPFVNIGAHETLVTLASGRWLARWTGLERLTRVKTLPVSLGLPWGLFATPFVPFIPLPAKFVYKVAPPILVDHDPERADDAVYVRLIYRRVSEVMQDMLSDLARRRRIPILG